MPNVNFQTIHQMGGINQVFRQALGLDNTQNIDMDWVTVGQNKRMRIVDTFTGNPITFTAEKAGVIGAEVGMWVKQNLNGQSYPWPAGGGNNIFDPDNVLKENNVILNRFISSTNGSPVEPNVAGAVWLASNFIPVNPGDDYYFGEDPTTASIAGTAFYDSNKTYISGVNATTLRENEQHYQIPENAYYMRHSFQINPPYNQNWQNNVYITLNSNPHTFTPYENICPITPWESVLITVNDADHLTEFPQDVYGGSYNTLTGELRITHKITTISALGQGSYYVQQQYFRFSTPDMERNIGDYKTIIKSSAYKTLYVAPGEDPPAVAPDYSVFNFTRAVSNDVVIRDTRYTSVGALKAAMGDTQICYPLANPIVLQLDKEEIPVEEGENTVSTNANTLTVTLYDLGDV